MQRIYSSSAASDVYKRQDILNAALEHGLLILTAKEKLRLLPPLTISYEDIDRGLEILAELLKKNKN